MLTFALLTLTLLLISIAFRASKRRNYPPGPFPWPIIGNQSYLKTMIRKFGGQHYAFLELHKRYNSGIISLRLGGVDVIVVSDNKLVQEVLSRKEYDGRPWNEFVKIRNFGLKKGITMNDGIEWKELRNWTVRNLRNVGFAKQKMEDLLTDEMLCVLKKLNEGCVHNIKFVISPAVINVIWKLLTGHHICNDKLRDLVKLLELRAKCFDSTGGILSSFPWLRYIIPNAIGYNVLMSVNNELKCLVMTTIDEHKKRYVEGAEDDYIDLFLREMMKEKASGRENPLFTDDNLLVSLVDFFIAGTNTTTSTMDFLFLHMIRYQSVQDAVHQEIDKVIGPNRLPSLEDRPNMPFTEAVLTECQRMWVVTPIIGPRRVLADTTLQGYVVPMNATVLINIFACNMNPELYPDPTSFKPERFLRNGACQSDDNAIMFGKGKRRCPGESLAKSAIFLLFVGIMQKYRLLPAPGEESFAKIDINTGLTISPKPYKTLFVRR